MSENGKTISKKSDKKNGKNTEIQCHNSAGKPFQKNQIKKTEKIQKFNVIIPHLNKKPLARNGNFGSKN